ncbi:MAG: D-alanine--D-alanine ligase [Holosporaceae bacterium]|jgi:D-alanine-D-alanine ligase|nr:D-alanine--D-alanine ligase [Holosporaceae bacterium]
MSKIRVGVFFGGRSSEHEISIKSAESIVKSLDKSKYDVSLVGADRDGRFHFGEKAISLNMSSASEMIKNLKEEKILPVLRNIWLPEKFDVVFPVFHGTFGEDGTIQGLLRLFDVPFVGAGVLGSAIGMDKDVTKRLLRDAGILTARHLTFYRHERNNITFEEAVSTLGDVLFIKPANLGSSVGVNKVKSKDDFIKAVEEAFQYDNKIIIEEFVEGREVECSVLGNECPKASVPGEIIVKRDFYSYSAKYLDEDGADLKIPADFPSEVSEQIRAIAVKAFKVLCCEGMARVDFFVKKDFAIFLNEINTIPGFTEKISMYPKLWAASGVSYSELLDELIALAISRHERDKKLSNRFKDA